MPKRENFLRSFHRPPLLFHFTLHENTSAKIGSARRRGFHWTCENRIGSHAIGACEGFYINETYPIEWATFYNDDLLMICDYWSYAGLFVALWTWYLKFCTIFSLLKPHLDYGSVVWMTATKHLAANLNWFFTKSRCTNFDRSCCCCCCSSIFFLRRQCWRSHYKTWLDKTRLSTKLQTATMLYKALNGLVSPIKIHRTQWKSSYSLSLTARANWLFHG